MIRGDNESGGSVVIRMNQLSGSLKLGDLIIIYPVIYGWIYLRNLACWFWRCVCCWLCFNMAHNNVYCLMSVYYVVCCVTTRLQPGFHQKRFLLLNKFFMIRYLFKSNLSRILWDTNENGYLSQVLEVVNTHR